MKSLEKRRLQYYWLLALGLVVAYMALRGHPWRGDVQLHTLMEVVATLLSLMVGTLALVRFYAHKSNTFLLIGTGFLGTAFLDGYHAVVTSTFFKPFMPSDLPSLIPWSWIASRLFLSVMLLLSLYASRRKKNDLINERVVYIFGAFFSLSCFLFFISVSLPRAYYDEFIFHRPEEFVPALFFLMALIGYLRKGDWKTEVFDHWLILSLITGLIGQVVFMSFSGALFDFEFDAAHTLKKISYICVLIGLFINIHTMYKQEESGRKQLRSVVDNIEDGIVVISEQGEIKSFNASISRMFSYPNQSLMGKNIQLLAAQSIHGGPVEHDKKKVGAEQFTRSYRSGEFEGIKLDGEHFPIHLQTARLDSVGSNAFLVVIRDLTKSKEVDRVKSEFLSTVSHELRTPMTSIKAALGMITGGALGHVPDGVGRVANIAEKNTERLISLVNDLLDIEKLSSGKMEFEFKELLLGPLIKHLIEINQPLAEQYQVRFKLLTLNEDKMVNGDSERLSQVFLNLLSNAAKFSPPKSVVYISLEQQAQALRVSVTDQGAGVPESFQKHIFGRFMQSDASDTRKKSGTGLGLYISKQIMARHSGNLGYSSTQGQGATFYFELPFMNEDMNLGAGDESAKMTPVLTLVKDFGTS